MMTEKSFQKIKVWGGGVISELIIKTVDNPQ